LILRPGTQNERGTQFGANLRIPFPCSIALVAKEFAAMITPPLYSNHNLPQLYHFHDLKVWQLNSDFAVLDATAKLFTV
jgi:hypothetical protein